MFTVVDLTLVDNDVQFTSTKRIMYGENIIRVEVNDGKFIDESQPFTWVDRKKHVYLNEDSFNKATQRKNKHCISESEWEK